MNPQAKIDAHHKALIANVEAAHSAVLRSAPRDTLEYHIGLAHRAIRNLEKINLPPALKAQAD